MGNLQGLGQGQGQGGMTEYVYRKQQAAQTQLQRRQQVLEEVVRLLCSHISAALALPQLQRQGQGLGLAYPPSGPEAQGPGLGQGHAQGQGLGAMAVEKDRLGSIVAHKISSLSSVARGHR